MIQRLSDKMFDPKQINEGDRKLAFAIYFLHIVLALLACEVAFYMLCRTYTVIEHKDLIELLEIANYLYCIGGGGALGIYSGANVFEWKSRGGSSSSVGKKDG